MDFSIEFTRCRELVDRELERLISNQENVNNKIIDSIEYSLFTGGKRVRPIIGLKSYEIFNQGNDYTQVIPFILAIELIHTYSLVHDDLPSMDNDDYRRGKPTNHIVYGEDMAILTGDGLLNMAFEIMLNSFDENDSFDLYKKKILAANNISKYSGVFGMIGGQVLDLSLEKDTVTPEKILKMYELKTSALIEAAAVSGAIIGGASSEDIEIIRRFAYYLGMSYQLQDDFIDLEEDNNIGKLTYISYFGESKSKKDLINFSNKAKDYLNRLSDGKDTDFFFELINSLNIREN